MTWRRNRNGLSNVSGFVTSPDAAETAVEVLLAGGIPRDLVEVVVSPGGNEEHYGGKARRLGTRTLSYAAKGALIGLFASIILSLYLLILPGFRLPEQLAFVQLLGPNIGTLLGAVVGGLAGALQQRQPKGVYARVGERDAILLVVLDRPREQAPVVVRLLEELGVEDVRIEPQEAPAAPELPAPTEAPVSPGAPEPSPQT